jgi:tetratricopeptide (TPR) repeat protein
MGLAYYTAGAYQAGRAACLQGLALRDRVAGWRRIGYLLAICGGSEVELGLLGQAWGHAQEVIEIGKKYEHGEILGMGYRILGDIYLRLLDYKKAAAIYEQGINSSGEHMVRLENQYHYGYCLLKLGQDIGYRYIEQTLEDAEKNGVGTVILYAAIYQLTAFLTKGDLPAFEQRAAWFREQIRLRLGKDWAVNTISRLRAWYFCYCGEFELAAKTANEVLPWFQGSSFLWARLECLNTQAIAQDQLGLDASAVRQEISAVLDQIASHLEDAPLQAELQACRQKYTDFLL